MKGNSTLRTSRPNDTLHSTQFADIRYDDDGELDELVCNNASIHIERINDGIWWMGIESPEGELYHLFFSSKKLVKAYLNFCGGPRSFVQRSPASSSDRLGQEA